GLLQRKTKLRVKFAEEGEALQPGHVYFAPPNRHLIIKEGGTVSLSASGKVYFTRPAADPLFLSMALHFKDRCMAVVLSGGGHDGAMGIRAVKWAKGITLTQSPDSCEHSSMAESAIATGCINLSVPPEWLPATLITLVMLSGAPALFQGAN